MSVYQNSRNFGFETKENRSRDIYARSMAVQNVSHGNESSKVREKNRYRDERVHARKCATSSPPVLTWPPRREWNL